MAASGETEKDHTEAAEETKASAPRPDITDLARSLETRPGIWALALIILCLLGIFYTFYFAREFFLPITLAVLLNFLLKPVVRKMARAHIPEPFGAAVVLVLLNVVLIYGIIRLSEPATQWVKEAPETLRRVEAKIRQISEPAQKLQAAAKKIEDATKTNDPETPQKVEIKKDSWSDVFLGYSRSVLFGFAETMIVLYFFLAAGDHFTRKLIRVLPRLHEKKEAVEITREIETEVSRYLGTITGINICEGIIVGLVMYFVGMPNPILWGALAAIVNFVPYLGATCNFIILLLVGLITFNHLGRALLPALLYGAINFLEGNILTPTILGRRLTLNAGVVFISLMLWGLLWGIPGMLVAVPLLVTAKIVCDHVQPLGAVSEFLTD